VDIRELLGQTFLYRKFKGRRTHEREQG